MARRKVSKTKTSTAKNKTTKNTQIEALDQDTDDLKDSSGNSNSSRKPSVMETLKRKSYLNAGKVSTNIYANSGSITNIISSSSSLVPPNDENKMTPSVNNKCNNQPQQSQQQQQQTSSVSFNNDQKYLHKKFKRIASATIDTTYTNNNNNQQESLAKSVPTEIIPHSTVPYESLSPLKTSHNNFSSANNSSSHPMNNNNLINNFKVVQNHTTSHSHKNVPQVMTAYENYIITKEKLTHHQVQQMDAAKMSDSFVSNTSINNNHKSSKKYEHPPNGLTQESFLPCTSAVSYQSTHQSTSPSMLNQSLDGQSTPGRHVCPFCQLVCTKPSVLEKHIRAHTNERPYPCSLCGFAFKTKSNLHKHFKSRAHMSRERGEEPHPDDDMASYGSDGETTDKDTSNSGLDMIRRISPVDERTSSPLSQQSMDKPYKPKFHLYPGKSDLAKVSTSKVSSGVTETSFIPTVSTLTMTTSTASVIHSKPINTGGSNFVLTASAAESVKQHIQKLISQNSAIIDGVEPALQKKYHKITGINRSISVDNSIGSTSSNNNVPHQRKSSLSIPPRELQSHQINLAAHVPPMTIAPSNIVIVAPKTPTVQNCQIQYQPHTQLIHPLQATPHSVQIIQQPILYTSASNVPSSPSSQQTPMHLQGPLNLVTKPTANEMNSMENTPRSRKTSQEIAEQVPVVDHPKNPERSIIKDLLLNSRTFGVVAEGETNDTPYICPTCKKVFQNADLLKYHTFCHCDGGNIGIGEQQHLYEDQSPQSAPISPVASPHQYIRSNSIHISSMPDAGSGKKGERLHSGNPAKIIKPRLSRQKPDNIIISHASNVSPVIEGASVDQFHLISHKIPIMEMSQAPLPSPGPLLGKTPLIDMYSMHRLDGAQVIERKMSLSEVEEYHYQQQLHQSKRPRYNSCNMEMGQPNMQHRSGHRMEKVQMFGGDMKILEKSSMGQFSSGGTMSSLSPNSDEMMEDAPVMVRTGLHSGGIAIPKEKDKTEKLPMTPKLVLTITPTLTITQTTQSMFQQKQAASHFQFPPLNTITGYNPLTLPTVTSTTPGQVQSIMHGGKLIPFVPGIPGPNTFNPKVENMSKKIMASPKTPLMPSPRSTTVPNNCMVISPKNLVVPSIKLEPFDDGYNMNNVRVPPQKQSFNFSRIADNISPSKRSEQEESKAASVVKLHQDQNDVRIFNYENLIAKNEIIVRSGSDAGVSTVIKQTADDKNKVKDEVARPNKFLRPSSLPLKPGTFTPKQHHGITPTANTLPLISPETPRPSKTCVQQYHNGHAYTYLGLKCSTKPFYCTVNKPQPAYCMTQAKLSMYSNWQVYPESKPHPLHLKPLDVMQCYRSYFKFERNRKFTISNTSKTAYTLVNSSETRISSYENPTQFTNPSTHVKFGLAHHTSVAMDESMNNGGSTGGNGEEEYVRGRGRGKYICETCGIKCKKPSMLKKHIRTHTDERPHTCTNCNFSFKTKGNLTKHMKSKAHYKKCIELGIPVEEYQGSEGDNASGGADRQNAMNTGFEDESDNENDSDCDEDTESDDNEDNRSRLPEHEAARCLLSLSMTPPATNLITSQQSQQPSPHLIKENIEPRLDELTCRRIITFAAPKTEFDLQGQYYSDPNLIKVNERSQQSEQHQTGESDDCPIDLTKRSKEVPVHHQQPPQQHHQLVQRKQQMKPKVSDVVLPITNTASLLASLMSITDKFTIQNQNGEHSHYVSDHPILPHKYITDRALLDTKIKQSQIKVMVNIGNNVEMMENHVIVPEAVVATVVQEPRVESMGEAGISMMDTLAEVAASSVKLDVTPVHSPKMNEEIHVNVEPGSKNFNAKSIASEFLKLTQNAKNHEKSSENDADGESGSDQDALLDKFNVTRTVVVGPGAFNAVNKKSKTGDSKAFMQDEGRPLCPICKKVFPKQSALKLHLNIHAMERKYKCGPCGQGFRTQGHLQKHNRSAQHQTKVSMTSTFGVPSQSNPRPFKCKDCSTQFRIHGHLAKHLRSKLHVMRLECLQKLPFGTYAEIERSGISLTNIDTSDCDTSLTSLQELARKIHESDPTKLIPVAQGNNMSQSGLNQSMDDLDDENAGTGLDSDGDYADSDDGQDTNHQDGKASMTEPINGMKRPFMSAFGSPHKTAEINSDTEKSLQDPLKLDTPPPRPVSAIPTMHHDTHTTEKRYKSDFT